MPSFVSTLSGLLALLGLQLYMLGLDRLDQPALRLGDRRLRPALVMPAWLSHGLALIPGIVMLVVGLRTMEQRRAAPTSRRARSAG